LCLFLAAWIARLYQFDAFVSYPLTLVWPATVVPAAILIDFVLLKTRSFVLTSILGGIVWTFAFWISNYVTLAAYLQPSLFMGHLLTMADVLGIQYLRSQTPEYLRLIENGTLRSFLGETQYRRARLWFNCGGRRLLDRAGHRALGGDLADRALHQAPLTTL